MFEAFHSELVQTLHSAALCQQAGNSTATYAVTAGNAAMSEQIFAMANVLLTQIHTYSMSLTYNTGQKTSVFLYVLHISVLVGYICKYACILGVQYMCINFCNHFGNVIHNSHLLIAWTIWH